MWFDVAAALAEIEGASPPAQLDPPAPPLARVAGVASVATPGTAKPTKSEAPATTKTPETFPHGLSFGDRPRTWTGRIVNLSEWRALSEWDRHGPNGRLFNGITRRWEEPGAADE